MAQITDLPGTAGLLLSLVCAAYEDAAEQWGIALLAPLPSDRRYVSPGNGVAWDGEQVTVNLVEISQGKVGRPSQLPTGPQAVTYYATFAVMVVRAVPVNDGIVAPDPLDLNAAGQQGMLDAALLTLASSKIHADYTLTRSGEDFVVGPVSTLGPEGGMAGTVLRLEVNLR